MTTRAYARTSAIGFSPYGPFAESPTKSRHSSGNCKRTPLPKERPPAPDANMPISASTLWTIKPRFARLIGAACTRLFARCARSRPSRYGRAPELPRLAPARVQQGAGADAGEEPAQVRLPRDAGMQGREHAEQQ